MANLTSTVKYCDVMFICVRRKGLPENIIGKQAVKETRQYKIIIKRFPVKTFHQLIMEWLNFYTAVNGVYLCSGNSQTTMGLMLQDPDKHVEMFTGRRVS